MDKLTNIAQKAKTEATRWLEVEESMARLCQELNSHIKKFAANNTDLAIDIVKAKVEALEETFAKARSTQLNRRALEAIQLLKPTMHLALELSKPIIKIYNAAPSAVQDMAEEAQAANS